MNSRLEGLNRPAYPKQMIVDVHSYCNATCVICPYNSLKDKLPKGVMEEELFRKIIDDYKRLGEKHAFRGVVIFCSMGEFFLYPELSIERMRYVLEAGLDFNIQTNAAAMVPKQIDRLLANGFKGSFMISCHGVTKEVYEPIMGLDLERTLANIDYLLEKYPKEKICIQAIPYHWPFGETRRVRKYWRQRDVHVRIPLPNNRAGLVSNLPANDKRRLLGCASNRPFGEMICNIKGDVQLCCNDMAQKEIVGNLGKNSIEEVWNGPGMTTRLGWLYCGERSPASFICHSCEFAVTSRSAWQRLKSNVAHEAKKLCLTYIR